MARAYRGMGIPMPEELVQKVFKSEEAKAIPIYTPSAERVIKTVRKAGGVIALAHPNNRTHLIPSLVELGLNGIEVSHPDLKENTPELASLMAEEYNLYRCGGTDHRGTMAGRQDTYPIPNMFGVTEEEFFTIKERRRG